MSATTSPTMNDMRTEVNWSILRSYLKEDKVTFEDLELPCGICRDTMTVIPHKNQEDGNTHRAVVLPCGHIFGKSCIEAAFNENSTLLPVCFACRTDLTHPQCGHVTLGKPMPSSKKDIDSIPEVLFKNGQMAPECVSCLVDETYKVFHAYALKFNSKSNDGQYLVFMAQVSDSSYMSWNPSDQSSDPMQSGKAVQCSEPNECTSALMRFRLAQKKASVGMHWLEGPELDWEWQFYTWTPPVVKPPKPEERTNSMAAAFWGMWANRDVDDEDEDEE